MALIIELPAVSYCPSATHVMVVLDVAIRCQALESTALSPLTAEDFVGVIHTRTIPGSTQISVLRFTGACVVQGQVDSSCELIVVRQGPAFVL